MFEIDKLRQRIKNANKTSNEYRMSLSEAKILLQEIDELIKRKVSVKDTSRVIDTPVISHKVQILDGGQF